MFLSKAQDEVVEAIEERMAMFSELPAANGEAMQVLKYEPGQKYDPHQDYFDDCSDGSTTSPHHKERQVRYCTEETGGQRVATILLYLTDVEHGGETVFPLTQKQVPADRAGNWSACGKTGLGIRPRVGTQSLGHGSSHPHACCCRYRT